MEAVKVDILSRELVKPSSPTPTHLKHYKLCLLDQFFPEIHCGILFFYSSPPDCKKNDDKNYCRILKDSLSETLTDFYPIAGRFKDTSTIDCNDDGACVVEAKLDSNLSDFLTSLSQPSEKDNLHQKLGKLNPAFDSETMELASKCMLIAQLTVFECGGTAICFSLQHRFCDLWSVVVFLKSWSARARCSYGEIAVPSFVGSSFLPPQDLPPLPPLENPIENRTMRRLVFEAPKISALKEKLMSEKRSKSAEITSVSRVEVVLALVLKSAISAARSIDESAKKSAVFCPVNLRKRTEPPLPENSMGNLIWTLIVETEEEEGEEEGNEFHALARKMKSKTTSFCSEKVSRLKGEEGVSLVFESVKKQGEVLEVTGDLNLYWCTSWCRFPVYETDFGWGKPVWVSSGILSSKNLIVMEDTKCGSGIQAWVTLDPKVMAIFERDEEILSFASFNPIIIVD
ncbi:Transferase [Parasponia andersonii]|uniref:Transferase n=1 Tax=Parasponia andersonii TaxID=3476 RepID=A0A2P5DV75_PARAD|nr:Transferase [Parasponia andersonii]